MSPLLRRLGLVPRINAAGTLTRLGGSLMEPEVLAAMHEAAACSLDIAELQSAASGVIAAATHAEAGIVTSGAAAGLTLATAACLAGRDVSRLAALPDTRAMPNRVLMARTYRNAYDRAIRLTGAEIVDNGHNDRGTGAGVRGLEDWEIEAARATSARPPWCSSPRERPRPSYRALPSARAGSHCPSSSTPRPSCRRAETCMPSSTQVKYRKMHLPGHPEHRPRAPYQNLEKRYYDVGDLGLAVWRAWGGVAGMLICNNRRWPEARRVLGLQGVEVAICGYNTPNHHPAAPDHADWASSTTSSRCKRARTRTAVGIAKAGVEEGVDQMAGSCIIAPNGEIVARAAGHGDEVIVARCDLDHGRSYRETTFNFALRRRVETYGLIVERTGREEPPANA